MTYDNTDERGEDAVARQRGGSEPGHLPECLAAHPATPDAACICDRLRACEARARASEFPLGVAVGKHDGFLEGYAAALDAARAAVAALPITHCTWADPGDRYAHLRAVTSVDGALAVLDALRGES